MFFVISVEVHVLFLIALTGQLGSLSGSRSLAGISLIEVFRLGSRGAEARTVDTPAVFLERTPDLKPVTDPTPIPSFHRKKNDPDRPNADQGNQVEEDKPGDDSDRLMPGSPDGAANSPDVDPTPDDSAGVGGPSSPGEGDEDEDLTQPARCASCPDPAYPALAQSREIEGQVEVTFQVLPDGSVGDIYISRSSGYPILDDAALATVKKWSYFPATRGGSPVSEERTKVVTFTMTSR